jgi:asparagine synthase (glutamine-hydrolysing)
LKPLVNLLARVIPLKPFVKGRRYIQKAEQPFEERVTAFGLYRSLPIEALFTPDARGALNGDYSPASIVRQCLRNARAIDSLDKELYLDLKLAISDNDLLKVTRMTEAAGVGVHFPFLDRHLADFAATIPARIKMKGRKLRSFFKEAYRDLLPREVLQKQKHGFGLPTFLWLRTDRALNEMMLDLVLSPRSIQRGLFEKKGIESLVEHHKTEATSFYGTTLWNLMILELWFRRNVDGYATPVS